MSLLDHSPKHAPNVDGRELMRQLAPYRQARTGRSLLELGVTLAPLVCLWALMCVALQAGVFVALVLALPAGALLLRVFLIQHDCGHSAFFASQAANDWLGRSLGVLTLTPYEYWRRSHAIHHATTGNLDARGVGDVDTLTVAEYRSRTGFRRLLYRAYRSPLVLFGLGPAYLFLVRHRLPIGMMRAGWRPWISAMGTNAAVVSLSLALVWLIGLELFFLVHLPIVLIAASLGVWFFYVQHQFTHTSWDTGEDWAFHQAALQGSSHYQLPPILRWVTANVGIHHVHHLASRIPFYRLGEAAKALPLVAATSEVTIRESLQGMRLVLWDERKRRLVSFREARTSEA